jgi:DNA replicative helicase MCM subunit Mcm2 (Cdc46/Mcm family)
MDELFKIAGGDLVVWLDAGGSICIKTVDKFNDPVEMAEHEAMELAELLMRLAKQSQIKR